MTYDQDWDRRLNPFRYNADGSLTDAAKRQNVTMELNSAAGEGDSGSGRAGHQTSVRTEVLTKAANTLEQLRSDTDKADMNALSATDAAWSALSNWQAANGLDRMHRRWAAEAGNLSKMLSDATAKLHNTTTSYEHTDQAEKSRMDSLNGGRN
ncbi:hypothetical protein DDE74_31455 [Streptomyces lydicus]|uniref:WXG100 family type VII secretion target n=1 Tax=Streptomyces lydicus TaxID=47763 RepID=A0A3S9YIM8_9ACTN|nr:hypothetical protein [Streptomyces lydicus]AZS74851.1 hypothetical protein DDE74_31455 [Streptomyces lydicus]